MKLEVRVNASSRLQFQTKTSLASFPGRRRNSLATSVSSNCYFRCLKVGSTNQISEHSHMTTIQPNCVMHWTVAVMPIPLQKRTLDHTSVGALHDGRSSNDLYFISVVEPTASSWFHEQESPILTAGKIISITCTSLSEWNIVTLHLYTVRTRGSCQAVSPMAWERG